MNLMNTVEYIYREIMLCHVGVNKILWVVQLKLIVLSHWSKYSCRHCV